MYSIGLLNDITALNFLGCLNAKSGVSPKSPAARLIFGMLLFFPSLLGLIELRSSARFSVDKLGPTGTTGCFFSGGYSSFPPPVLNSFAPLKIRLADLAYAFDARLSVFEVSFIA